MAFAAALKNWLFRWKSDGTDPIVLTQRRIFILPAKAGFLYAGVLVVMLLGAINYNLALGHALVFLLAGVGFIGMIHTFRNLVGLMVSGGRTEPVFAGEIAHFPLHLFNDRKIPRMALEFQAGSGPVVTCNLQPEGRARIELPLSAERRGWLPLPRVRLSTRYPLGFFVAWSYPQPAMACLVYPRPLDFPLPPASPASTMGERQGEGGQEDFAGLRERQPADSPRHIAWKAVARDFDSRPLLTKQFAGGAQTELWLDWRFLAPDTDVETRLSILSGWILAAERSGILYGLRLPGTELRPAQGPAHRRLCLEALALLPQP